jgi:outer membrane protein assembly factor BamE (lipoprotein component of BamABCDE complex)
VSMRVLPLICIVAAVALSGCSRITDVKGYIADETLVSAIQPGVDNKTSVEKTLGRPSLVSEFDANTWYYVSQRTEQFAFLTPKPVMHQVLMLQFNAKGDLLSVNKLGRDQLVAVNPSNDKTPTGGKETGFFKDLFSGIGTVTSGGTGTGGGPPQ